MVRAGAQVFALAWRVCRSVFSGAIMIEVTAKRHGTRVLSARVVIVCALQVRCIANRHGIGPLPGRCDPARRHQPYIVYQQRMIEGLCSNCLDPEDIEQVFHYVFSQLPPVVRAYPTGDYYYFQLFAGGRRFWGNLHPLQEIDGKTYMGCALGEFMEFPDRFGFPSPLTRRFGRHDGCTVRRLACGDWLVTCRGKRVKLLTSTTDQLAPRSGVLRPTEIFLGRTVDESGLTFLLLFDTQSDCFLWVLDPGAFTPDVLEPLGERLVVGRTSGFAFWVDVSRDSRYVLAAVPWVSVARNHYCDGPFDQLPEGLYADPTFRDYIRRWQSASGTTVANAGPFAGSGGAPAVAIKAYGSYRTFDDLVEFVGAAESAEDPLRFFSLEGRMPEEPEGRPPRTQMSGD